MTIQSDWIPRVRLLVLTMADNWTTIFRETARDGAGKSVTKAALWEIPGALVSALEQAAALARDALRTAMSDETGTKVATEACKAAFRELKAMMRSIKRKYLVMPPLTEPDFIALGLKVPKRTHKVSGTPTAQVGVRIFPTGGFYEIGAEFDFISGDKNDPANKAFRLYYMVVAPGEKAPESPEELTRSFSEKRDRTILRFDPQDSGKKVYMAAQIENGRKKGPWGPMTEAVIP